MYNDKETNGLAINGSGNIDIDEATIITENKVGNEINNRSVTIKINGGNNIKGTINIKNSTLNSNEGIYLYSSCEYEINIENSEIIATKYGIATGEEYSRANIVIEEGSKIISDDIGILLTHNNNLQINGGRVEGKNIGISHQSNSR